MTRKQDISFIAFVAVCVSLSIYCLTTTPWGRIAAERGLGPAAQTYAASAERSDAEMDARLAELMKKLKTAEKF